MFEVSSRDVRTVRATNAALKQADAGRGERENFRESETHTVVTVTSH